MEQLINPVPTAAGVDDPLALAASLYERGELALAADAAREAQADPANRAVAIALEAAAEAQAGRLAAAVGRLLELKPLAATLTQPAAATCAAYQVETWMALGRPEAACAAAEAGYAGLEADTAFEGLLDAVTAAALSHIGRHEDGLQRAERAMNTAQKSGAQALVLRAAIARAELALRASDWEAAQHAATEGLAVADGQARLGAARLYGILGEAALGRGEKTASGHFEAMKLLAEASGARALLAQALFGLAAAGTQPETYEKVSESQRLVRESVSALEAEAAAHVLAIPELARILAGNHVAFGRPRRRRSPTGPVGFPPRMMGW